MGKAFEHLTVWSGVAEIFLGLYLYSSDPIVRYWNLLAFKMDQKLVLPMLIDLCILKWIRKTPFIKFFIKIFQLVVFFTAGRDIFLC